MAHPLNFFFLLFVSAVVSVRGAGLGLVSPVPIGKRYIVGGADGWRVPPRENKDLYLKWASTIEFFVEDSIEFMYKNDSVGKVNKYAYYHCNWTTPTSALPAKDGSSLFLLDAPGIAYFASADIKHCKKGQRLMLNVKGRPTLAPSADISSPPAPVSPTPAPGPAVLGEPVMDSGATTLASSSSHALALVVSVTTLALMGRMRT
ncbi:stellacyanin-like [Triticum urartu]|uniref:Phytocyanin domain-containing protein n=1 Tax=Triticum urartu TaxID=4572 RepID=A0A8R7R1G6_TRIUA|nr:stellacyanin-like [Triticum urartu]